MSFSIMFLELITLSLVAVTPSLNTVVQRLQSDCTSEEFRCADGSCVPFALVCDGTQNCAGGADEARCHSGAGAYDFTWPSFANRIHREKRQNTRCTGAQWRCRSGECIASDGKCDGVRDCADGSDETHALCRNTPCPDHLFRCAYGACVDGYGKCDKQQNCVDNSDELHRDCFPGQTSVANGRFKCANGTEVSSTVACDGRADCADGSDETVRACGAMRCHAIHFQCAYGACVDSGSDCDDKIDCADGSDESAELCNRIGTVSTAPPRPTTQPQPTNTGNCVLPPYPEHGRYTVQGNPLAQPGQTLEAAFINVTCEAGYQLSESASPFCYANYGWSVPMPTCSRFCQLNPHKSVTYSCVVSGTRGGTKPCSPFVPSGTQVIPTCNSPIYYSRYPLQYMRCREDGQWDNIEICEPECGKITPDGEPFVIDGWATRRGEFPWHVGVYRKDVTPYMQICGGTIVSSTLVLSECGKITPDGEPFVIDGWATRRGEFPWHVGVYRKDVTPYVQICGGTIVSSTLVLSAAHCFYTDAEGLRPASKFAVAAGKLYRPWDESHDADAQKSDVSDIKITDRYRGSSTNYQEDIALVFVSKPFEYKVHVAPACLDFDYLFNGAQLSEGSLGSVAGWGLTKESGQSSPILLTVRLPYIPPRRCIDDSPAGFREYLTGDKFCAGYTNGTSLCKGDSGGGLVFGSTERSATRYYLRGIVSTGPHNSAFTSCDSHFYTTFTEIFKHETFIRPHYIRS